MLIFLIFTAIMVLTFVLISKFYINDKKEVNLPLMILGYIIWALFQQTLCYLVFYYSIIWVTHNPFISMWIVAFLFSCGFHFPNRTLISNTLAMELFILSAYIFLGMQWYLIFFAALAHASLAITLYLSNSIEYTSGFCCWFDFFKIYKNKKESS